MIERFYAMRKDRFAGFAREFRAHWAKRPWLCAVPAAGLASLVLLHGVIMTIAVSSVFAALWESDGRSVNFRRVLAAAFPSTRSLSRTPSS